MNPKKEEKKIVENTTLSKSNSIESVNACWINKFKVNKIDATYPDNKRPELKSVPQNL